MNRRYEHLLSPIRVGNHVLKNRMINAQSVSQELQGPEIYPSEAYQRYTTDYAKNGAAIVNLTVGSWPDKNGGHGPMDQFYMENRKVLNYFSKQIDRVHAFDSLACGNLPVDFGRVQISEVRDRSVLTFRGDYGGFRGGYGSGPVLTKAQIDFALDEAAVRAADLATLGFDVINIHMSYRGGLLAHALSPALNQREDEYGGSPENRARLPLELFRRIRAAVAPNTLLQCQVSGIEEEPYGYTTEDFLDFCQMCEELVDIFQIRGWDGSTSHTSTYNFDAHNPYCLQFAEAFKKRGVKALCAPIGGFQDPDDMDKFIAEGKTDLIGLARAFICDPEFARKLEEGRGEDIVPCIRCDRCHGAVCSVNPKIGLAHVMGGMFDPPAGRKKVAVIGGGPAGMKAALTAAERGHSVTLFEKKPALGGQLVHADCMSFKAPLRAYKSWLIGKLGRADVDVRLATEATPELIRAGGYDAVIAGCGSVPLFPDIPGVRGKNVLAPIDVFGREETLGGRIVVIGGALMGAETAAHLAQSGKDVTLVTRQKRPCDDHESHAERVFRELLEGCGMKIVALARTVGIDGTGVTYLDADGAKRRLAADTVVMSGGVGANVDECMRFAGLSPKFFIIGDSNVRVSDFYEIHFATPEGHLNDSKVKVFTPNVRHATFTAFTAASQL